MFKWFATHVFQISASLFICIVQTWLYIAFAFYRCFNYKLQWSRRVTRNLQLSCWQVLMTVQKLTTSLYLLLAGNVSPVETSCLSVLLWHSWLLWRSGMNLSLPPFQHQTSSFLQREGSDLLPANSWSKLSLPVTYWLTGEPSPHPGTTRWPQDRNARRCPWKLHPPLCQRSWCRRQGQRSPPAWHRSCQICLRWQWLAWSSRTCIPQGDPAGRPPRHSGLFHPQIWQELQSFEPGDGNKEGIQPKWCEKWKWLLKR